MRTGLTVIDGPPEAGPWRAIRIDYEKRSRIVSGFAGFDKLKRM